ncbi:Iron-sulfur cluster-binding protein, RIESKE family OS=Streptomyces antimycoticus OX=68175 GN=SANT12839_007100 PE=4 SV=1 [Streptomyces antimycoticus]
MRFTASRIGYNEFLYVFLKCLSMHSTWRTTTTHAKTTANRSLDGWRVQRRCPHPARRPRPVRAQSRARCSPATCTGWRYDLSTGSPLTSGTGHILCIGHAPAAGS